MNLETVVAIVETRLAASPAGELKIISDIEGPVSELKQVLSNQPRPSRVPHPLLFLKSASLKVELNMQNRTDTLETGSRAPDFSLGAANREGTFNLGGLLGQGALILEFLRGTW